MSTTRSPTRPWIHVLLLASLLAVLGAAQCLAQAPATSPAIPSYVAAAADPGTSASPAEFLASLSLDGSGKILLTSCTDNSQCTPPQLCCRACGFFGCTAMACLNPFHGGCPPIP